MEDERTGIQHGEILAGGGLGRGAEPPATASQPITSESLLSRTQRFIIKLNGVTKTLDTATGAAVHRLAGGMDGYPAHVMTGGVPVPNTDAPFAMEEGQEFTS
jgi:hypothetical protein